MGKYQINTYQEKCTGCLRCQLACSEIYSKRFNPSQARIRVMISEKDWALVFSENCEECGICADQCFYGALEKTRKAVSS
jgi:Fe-S-cluster-containing hydrogenase component 2